MRIDRNFLVRAILLACIALSDLRAENIPPEKLNDALKIPEKSIQKTRDYSDAKLIVNDEYFIQCLRSILDDTTLSDEEKIYGFYLLQKKIGWAFCGTAYIPSRKNYCMVFSGYVGVYAKTRQKLEPMNYDVASFCRIAQKNLSTNSVLSANAIFLASMLNPKASQKDLRELLDYKSVQSAQVPDIMNHYLCLASIFTIGDQVERLGRNLELISSEEAKEDIICILHVYQDQEAWEPIKRFMSTVTDSHYGTALETAFFALMRRMQKEEFQLMIDDLILRSVDSWKKGTLIKLMNNEIPYYSSGSKPDQNFIKVWDSFNITIYDDAYLISYKGHFKEVIRRKPVVSSAEPEKK